MLIERTSSSWWKNATVSERINFTKNFMAPLNLDETLLFSITKES
jgi:hypothetical protein